MSTLEKIRAEIAENQKVISETLSFDKENEFYNGKWAGFELALAIIDKYAEQEPTTRQSCENCKQDQKECGNDDHYGFCQNWEYEVRCNSRKGNCVECVEQFICEEPCEEKKRERANETSRI